MSAAAQAYQESIHKYQQRERSVPAAAQPPTTAMPDVPMTDSAVSVIEHTVIIRRLIRCDGS